MEQQRPYYPPPAAPTSGLAIASLVFSVLGILQVLPLIGPVVGIILGYMAKGAINDSRGAIGGDGLAKGGIIIGWITIALYLVAGCLFLLFAVVLPILGLGGLSLCSGLESFQY